jgi:predicted esterase
MATRISPIPLAAIAAVGLTAFASDARIQDVSFPDSAGVKTSAWLVEPAKQPKAKQCAVLFVHWYDSEAGDSNRNQYLREAIPLTDDGCVSLLIDTMWSKTPWFRNRDAARDFENSEKQVRDLAKALDFLLARKNIDPDRVFYVGHDFGAMYGMVLSSKEKRIKGWALQAGTASFSDWFLFFPRKEGADRQAVIDRLAPLDPVKHIPTASPLLLQFGTHDRFVPKPKADQLFAAASEPKQILWYEAGHALDEKAVEDRLAWLRKHIHKHH